LDVEILEALNRSAFQGFFDLPQSSPC